MKGPALLLAGIVCFCVLDASTKLLSGTYGPGQTITFRYAVVLALIAAVRWAWPGAGGPLLTRNLRVHLWRAGFMLVSAGAFFMGFRRIPLAEGYLVFFTAPLLVLALTALTTEETVSRAAWTWCLVGFGGVLLAVAQKLAGGGSLLGYLFVICGTCTFALTQLMNRQLRGETGAARLLFYPALVGLLGYLPPGLVHWVPPSPAHALQLCFNGALAAGGILFSALAYRVADAARLGPYGFAALPVSVLLDWVVFHHPPEAMTFVGGAVVVAACVMSERSRRQGISAGNTCAPSGASGSATTERTAESGNSP